MRDLLPIQPRQFFRTQFLPPLVLALMFVAWLGLAPWRPMLASDDFGFYDSVIRTMTEGRPIVSDWLSPATVGLSLPAVLGTWLVGDLWIGSMVIMGLFGVVGLAALWSFLHRLAMPPGKIALTMLIVGFFPIYIGKWTRFESSVPAISLQFTALALMIRVFRPYVHMPRPAWFYSLVAGICIAWAVAIRQNHIVTIFVCVLGILLTPSLQQRGLLLITWTLPAILTLIGLRLWVPLTFAQRTATFDTVIAQFSVVAYGTALLRNMSLSLGIAMVLVQLIVPRTIFILLRQMTGLSWLIGLTSSAVLLLYAGSHQWWLLPYFHVLLLQLTPSILLIVSLLLGSLCWWSVVTNISRSVDPWISGGLLLMLVGYLALMAAWGYLDYYLLEPIMLLVIMLLMHTTADSNYATNQIRSPRLLLRFALGRIALVTVITIYILLSWTIQRMSNDVQATQLQVIEHAFRDHIAIPADIEHAPFGLLGWNLFPHQIARWSANPNGLSLAFWELESPYPSVGFRWGCQIHDHILRSGSAQVGWQPQCWSLVEYTSRPRSATLITDHRYLPLTALEWQQLLTGK